MDGNYGDNVILNFKQYQNLGAGDPLAPALNGTQIDPSGGGKEYDTNLFSQLRADVANGTLPQVSWIAAPTRTANIRRGPRAAANGT